MKYVILSVLLHILLIVTINSSEKIPIDDVKEEILFVEFQQEEQIQVEKVKPVVEEKSKLTKAEIKKPEKKPEAKVIAKKVEVKKPEPKPVTKLEPVIKKEKIEEIVEEKEIIEEPLEKVIKEEIIEEVVEEIIKKEIIEEKKPEPIIKEEIIKEEEIVKEIAENKTLVEEKPVEKELAPKEVVEPVISETRKELKNEIKKASVVEKVAHKIIQNQNVEGLKYKIYKSPNPKYPTIAKKVGYKKKVIIKVRFLVDEKGKIEEIKFYDNHAKYGFHEEVEKTLNKWKFSPVKMNGDLAKMYFYKKFVFQIK